MTVAHFQLVADATEEVKEALGELIANLDRAIGAATESRARLVADREERHAAVAVAFTPVPYRCRLEWVEQDGIPGRAMACRWGR